MTSIADSQNLANAEVIRQLQGDAKFAQLYLRLPPVRYAHMLSLSGSRLMSFNSYVQMRPFIRNGREEEEYEIFNFDGLMKGWGIREKRIIK